MSTPSRVNVEDLPAVLKFKRGRNAFADVAEEAGLSASVMRRLERDEEADPKLGTLQKVAAYLDRPIVIEPEGDG